jgi:hypothetical protein
LEGSSAAGPQAASPGAGIRMLFYLTLVRSKTRNELCLV